VLISFTVNPLASFYRHHSDACNGDSSSEVLNSEYFALDFLNSKQILEVQKEEIIDY
jgi:hypothetical protein